MALEGSLSGRVALVTGASRGIGADIAKYLARAGAAVAVCARTEEQQNERLPGTIHSVAQEITEEGGQALAIRVDMRDLDSVEAAVKRTVQELGGLDIVVNNAAAQMPGTIDEYEPRHLELLWSVDLRGPVTLMHHALPHMRARGMGHIINVSSVRAVFPGPGPYPQEPDDPTIDRGIVRGSFYGMLKAGLERFSQDVARHVQTDNISVNVLSPQGGINTPGLLYFTRRDTPVDELPFEEAEQLGKATVWICEQPPQEFTGNILFDQDLCREQGL
jgi:NAD(P)-dependent dehydrogenase (short-subunit alcohol dehydrogenase family)